MEGKKEDDVKKRIDSLDGFYNNLIAYVLINSSLICLSLFDYFLLFLSVIIAYIWGIIIILNYLIVFVFNQNSKAEK